MLSPLKIYVIKTSLMHCLSSVYFVNQALHVSDIFYSPSSGGTLYIYNNWYMLCSLVIWLLAGLWWNWPVPSQPYLLARLGWNWTVPSQTCLLDWLGWNWPVPSQLGQQAGFGWNWSVPSHPDQESVNWKAQHVPIVVYIQYTSWCWATNMPEKCRGWLTK